MKKAAGGKVFTKSRPAFDRCMECEKPPTVEILWAEGMARAWFCNDCSIEWKRDNPGDVVEEHEVIGGVVSKWRDHGDVSTVVHAFIAKARSEKGSPVRLVVKDSPTDPRYWDLDRFGPALRQLAEVIGVKNELELEFNPNGDDEAEPLCDLVISKHGHELVRASRIKLTLLGVGATNSETSPPAGLLIEIDKIRVMIDGGKGPGGDAIPKGSLDAWFITDEHDDLKLENLRGVAGPFDVNVMVGSFYKDGVSIWAFPVELVGHPAYGYAISAGGRTIIYTPEFGKFPDWATGADLMFADGVGDHLPVETVTDLAKKLGVKKLVLARVGETSGATAEIGSKLDFGEWGADGNVYTPKVMSKKELDELFGAEDEKAVADVVDDQPQPLLLSMEAMEKAKDKQYTFGVIYKATDDKADPELDAHHEFIIAEDLQEAQWSYVQTGDRRIYLQHGAQGIIPIGEYVDIVTWPHEVEVELTLPNQTKKVKTTIPAGSVWMGVLWNDTGWPLVKDGLIRGFSLGGFRSKAEFP